MSDSWPPEPIPPVGYLSRKALPIKRNDAEILTREDVQFDLLDHIFSDQKAVFTSQTPGSSGKITFQELYVNALYNSNKCSKVLKEKMVETPAFGLELAKISLLTNVGRINTTMAFFPEMKTALRTYHPVPSLQKTDGNAQDAPRIKNCLKAALLPSEFKSVPPSSPDEVLDKKKAGVVPPTSVVNLIFVLANHAAPLASIHFDGTLNFLDLFLPKAISSPDRARVFLWLIYHYLEFPETPNPFDDAYSRKTPGKAPSLRALTPAEMAKENIDTPEELEWGKKMSGQRNVFLQKLVNCLDTEKKAKPAAPHFVPAVPQSSSSSSNRSRSGRRNIEPLKDEGAFMYYVPGDDTTPPYLEQSLPRRNSNAVPTISAERSLHVDKLNGAEDYVQPLPSVSEPVLRPRRQAEEKIFLQQAWHSALNSDPLLDSDEENADENLRLDYARRLSIISRIRGRPPTPDHTTLQVQSSFHPPNRSPATFTGRFQRVESWD